MNQNRYAHGRKTRRSIRKQESTRGLSQLERERETERVNAKEREREEGRKSKKEREKRRSLERILSYTIQVQVPSRERAIEKP